MYAYKKFVAFKNSICQNCSRCTQMASTSTNLELFLFRWRIRFRQLRIDQSLNNASDDMIMKLSWYGMYTRFFYLIPYISCSILFNIWALKHPSFALVVTPNCAMNDRAHPIKFDSVCRSQT